MRRYYVADLIKLTGLKRITIDKRLSSKYAKERWGVNSQRNVFERIIQFRHIKLRHRCD